MHSLNTSGPPFSISVMPTSLSWQNTTATSNTTAASWYSNMVCQGSCSAAGQLSMKTSCSSTLSQDASKINDMYNTAFAGSPFVSAVIYKDASCKSLIMSYAMKADGKCHSLSSLSLIISLDAAGQVSIQEFLNQDCSGQALISSKFPLSVLKSPGSCIGSSGQFMVARIAANGAKGIFKNSASALYSSGIYYMGLLTLLSVLL